MERGQSPIPPLPAEWGRMSRESTPARLMAILGADAATPAPAIRIAGLSASTPPRISTIRSFFPSLLAALAASLVVAPFARSQSSQGAINVAATILPRPIAPSPQVVLKVSGDGRTVVRIGLPSRTTLRSCSLFIRVARAEHDAATRAPADVPVFRAVPAELQLPPSSTDVSLRLERLVLAGT